MQGQSDCKSLQFAHYKWCGCKHEAQTTVLSIVIGIQLSMFAWTVTGAWKLECSNTWHFWLSTWFVLWGQCWYRTTPLCCFVLDDTRTMFRICCIYFVRVCVKTKYLQWTDMRRTGICLVEFLHYVMCGTSSELYKLVHLRCYEFVTILLFVSTYVHVTSNNPYV